MARNLIIILRTCTRVNMINDSGRGRYIKTPKQQLTNTCVSSLVSSINEVVDHTVRLVVLDDHSSAESVADIKRIISHCKFPSEFISIDGGSGNGFSMSKMFEQVETKCIDLWYHVEDDYLHLPEAINDMINSVDQFESNTGRMIAINPHDDVWRYTNQIYESILLLGPYRHYRTVKHTTYTCLASKAIYDKYRDHFQDIVKLDGKDWVEDKSINLVWNQPDVLLFSPIPGLAFHIMDESGKDPYFDIMALWDSIPKLWVEESKPKIAVVSMYNHSHAELGAVTWPNKQRYADKHGYLSICKTDDWTLTPIHFEKLKLMLDVMSQHPDIDWVWWLDNDAIITNADVRLEDIVDTDYHVIITPDVASLNSGSFIVRNSLQGRNWLQYILAKGLEHYSTNRWPEQQPMTDFYISFQDIIKVVPQRTMNSYNYEIYGVDGTDQLGVDGQWQTGHFVLHMPAINNQLRLQIIKQLT